MHVMFALPHAFERSPDSKHCVITRESFVTAAAPLFVVTLNIQLHL